MKKKIEKGIVGMFYPMFLFLLILWMIPSQIRKRWRHRGSVVPLGMRLGLSPPKAKGETRFWIHAVSVGEVNATAPLIEHLRAEFPKAFFLITTGTMTGFAQAGHTLKRVDAIRVLPFDFPWIMRRWVRSFRPSLLICVEGDLWPNLLNEVKKIGGHSALVSGKISLTSLSRFRRFPSFSRFVFSSIDLILAQNGEQLRRFHSLVTCPALACGNLKLDCKRVNPFPTALQTQFSLSASSLCLTLASTHDTEEKLILSKLHLLWKVFPDLILFLAPRHPERCRAIQSLLESMDLPYCFFGQTRKPHQLVILVDQIGVLPDCFLLSRLTILGGGFQKDIGGHNVLEPCLHGCPVFFGPYMHNQRDLVAQVLNAKAGKQVSESSLFEEVIQFFSSEEAFFREKAQKVAEAPSQIAKKTVSHLASLCR